MEELSEISPRVANSGLWGERYTMQQRTSIYRKTEDTEMVLTLGGLQSYFPHTHLHNSLFMIIYTCF